MGTREGEVPPLPAPHLESQWLQRRGLSGCVPNKFLATELGRGAATRSPLPTASRVQKQRPQANPNLLQGPVALLLSHTCVHPLPPVCGALSRCHPQSSPPTAPPPPYETPSVSPLRCLPTLHSPHQSRLVFGKASLVCQSLFLPALPLLLPHECHWGLATPASGLLGAHCPQDHVPSRPPDSLPRCSPLPPWRLSRCLPGPHLWVCPPRSLRAGPRLTAQRLRRSR